MADQKFKNCCIFIKNEYLKVSKGAEFKFENRTSKSKMADPI